MMIYNVTYDKISVVFLLFYLMCVPNIFQCQQSPRPAARQVASAVYRYMMSDAGSSTANGGHRSLRREPLVEFAGC